MLDTPSGISIEAPLPLGPMEVIAVSLNAASPMLVTPFGIVMEVNDEHSIKAQSAIFVTLSGIVTDAKLVHLLKTLPLILVTLSGITIEGREVQP